jgi:Kef-type K+ transport system membrane component KefB/Trk K+ transport system NAD-binding subunit
LGIFLLTILLAVGASRLFLGQGYIRDVWMVSLILSTTSLGIVVPVLKERNLTAETFGQTVLIAALLADFATMFLITVYVALRSQGLSLEILLVGVLFVAALFVYRIGVKSFRKIPAGRFLEEITGSSTQTKVHGAVALLIAFVVLANIVGAEMILGAFLAGSVLSLMGGEKVRDLRHRLEAIGFGFFIPLFFIVVGLRFDLPALFRGQGVWLFTVGVLAAAYVVKIVPSLLLRLRFSWRQTLAGGMILSSRLSLIIAASGIGLSVGALGEQENAAFILIAVVTSTLSPLAFGILSPSEKQRGERPVAFIGVNALGLQTAKELREHGDRIVFFETDPRQADHARQAGFEVVEAASPLDEGASSESPPFKRIMILTSDDDRNLALGKDALALGYKNVVALVSRTSRVEEFEAAGLMTYNPDLYRTLPLTTMARNPDLFRLLSAGREAPEFREIEVLTPGFVPTELKDLKISGDVLILSVHRGTEILVPRGGTRIEPGDLLMVLGESAAVEALSERLEG